MEEQTRKCMVCGKPTPLKGGICEPCQERIRREAVGGQAENRGQAEKELRKHGVNPGGGKERK